MWPGAAGAPFSAVEQLPAAVALATSQPRHVYPWPELERQLTSDGRDALWLIGYGSLMNADSAARSMGRAGQRTPVVAAGVRRVFNCVMTPAADGPYGPVGAGRERAALNVCPTGDPADVVNGVLCQVQRADVPALRAREWGYDLITVACVAYHEPRDAPMLAYILAAPDPQPGVEAVTDDALLPHREYTRVCREGARSVSAAFEAMFLATTFLGDRRTLLSDWMARA